MNKDNDKEYRFLLFGAFGQKNSVEALKNVKDFLERYLKDLYELKTIDVTKDSKFALEKGVYFTPMLIMTHPLPEAYLAGDMSDYERMKKTIVG